MPDKTKKTRKSHKFHKHAFTLAELILSLAITTMIGLAVAGAAMALSSANEYGQDRYLALQAARMSMRNIQDTARKAKLVTGVDQSTMILWADDANGNGKINITELLMVRLHPSSGQLYTRKIVYPTHWPQWLLNMIDFQLTLQVATRVSTIQRYLDRNYYGKSTVLAHDVVALSLGCSPSAPMTGFVGVELTTGQEGKTVSLRSAVKLRADSTDNVGMAGGQYVLMDAPVDDDDDDDEDDDEDDEDDDDDDEDEDDDDDDKKKVVKPNPKPKPRPSPGPYR